MQRIHRLIIRFFFITVMMTVFLLSGLMLKHIKAQDNIWTQTEGPYGAPVAAIAIDSINPNIIYASTLINRSGVFKSIDGGSTWTNMDNGLPDGFIPTLAINPLTPTTLFAGVHNTIYKTDDGGVNWVAMNNGFGSSNISEIVINPITPTVL